MNQRRALRGPSAENSGRLEPGARLVLVAHTLFLLGVSLSNIYVNIFLFKVGESLAVIGWYHVYQYLAIALGFVVAGKWAEQSDRTISYRIGIGLHALFYLLILFLGEQAVDLVRELGLLLGFGQAFYWLGNHTLTFDLTDDGNRDYFNSTFTVFSSLATMLAPFAAGLVITRWPELAGYRLIFLVSLLSFVASVVVSLFLRPRESDGLFKLDEAFQGDGNPAWRSVLLVHFINGMRGGVFAFFIGILLYITTGTEMSIGWLALVTGAVTLTLSWLLGRQITARTRRRPLLVGLFATSLGVLVLAFNLNPFGIVLFALIEAAFAPMYGIPFGALNYRVLEQDPDVADLRIEYMVAKEIPLNLGRIVGVFAFLVAVPYLESDTVVAALLLGLGWLPLLTWRALRHIASTV